MVAGWGVSGSGGTRGTDTGRNRSGTSGSFRAN